MAYIRCGTTGGGVNLKNLPDKIVFDTHSAAQLDGENNHRSGAMHSIRLSVPVSVLKMLGYKNAEMKFQGSNDMTSSVNLNGTTVSVKGTYAKTISLQNAGETLSVSANGENHRDQANKYISITITK